MSKPEITIGDLYESYVEAFSACEDESQEAVVMAEIAHNNVCDLLFMHFPVEDVRDMAARHAYIVGKALYASRKVRKNAKLGNRELSFEDLLGGEADE